MDGVNAGLEERWNALRHFCSRNLTNASLNCKPKGPETPGGYNFNIIAYFEFLVLSLVLCLFVYSSWWKKRHRGIVETSLRLVQVSSLAKEVVRRLLPAPLGSPLNLRGLRPPATPVSLELAYLGLRLKDRTHRALLEGVTGAFKPFRMAAVMGPSGAGKTTLLNTMCGKASYGTPTGDLFVNGVKTSIDAIKGITGFVPQEDIVHEQLTVRENLMNAAQLKHGSRFPQSRLTYIVEDVINILHIQHIQQSIVGGASAKGISGGQRKRVNIGLELVGEPTVLFLDEPTSGLDSATSLAVVSSLKNMAKLGMTVIMVIHQPRYSLFTLFDDVCLLGQGGWTAFFGPSTAAKDYFGGIGFRMPENENPADWFMDILSGEVGLANGDHFTVRMLDDLWKQHGESRTSSIRGPPARQVSEVDAHKIFRGALQDEWSKALRGRGKKMNNASVAKLLVHLAGSTAADSAVEELAADIVGSKQDGVTKSEFLEYWDSWLGSGRPTTPDGFRGTPPDCSWSTQGSGASEPLLMPVGARGERAAGWLTQFLQILHRVLLMCKRSIMELFFFLALSVLVGVMMGYFISLMLQDPGILQQIYAAWIFQLVAALLVAVRCSFLFENKLMFWRERNRGMNIFSYFLARVLVDAMFAVYPMYLLYLTTFYCCYVWAQPDPMIDLIDWHVPTRLLTLVASGWGYLLSAAMPGRLASVGSVIAGFIIMAVGAPPVVHHFVGHGILEWAMFPMVVRWSTQWVSLAIFAKVNEAPKAGCVPAALDQPLANLTTAAGRYVEDQCNRGTLEPLFLMANVTKTMESDSYRQVMPYVMSSASGVLSDQIKQVYEHEGMLSPYFGQHGAIVVVLLAQFVVLYFLTYCALRHGSPHQQI